MRATGCAIALVALGIIVLSRLGSFGARAILPLVHLSQAAGAFAVVAGVALIFRWRFDGRAVSWWVSLALIVLGTPDLVGVRAADGGVGLTLASLTIALALLVVSLRSNEVDTRLSIVRAVAVLVGSLAATFVIGTVLVTVASADSVVAYALAAAYAALALLWHRDQPHESWLTAPVLALAAVAAVVAFVPGVEVQGAAGTFMQLLAHIVAAAGALIVLHASVGAHREKALVEQREREIAEARFAETMHEVRSAVVALEGGIRFLQPNKEMPADAPLARALSSELHRLRMLVDPSHASDEPRTELRAALEPLFTIAQAGGWRIRWDIERDVYVSARAVDVAQIVHGLLTNAHRYAPGQTIDVTALTMPEFAVISVEDCGPGVRAQDRERIFLRGFRSEQMAQVEGSGLGLHIARRIARDLDGDLWVSESFAGGARFVLMLPLSQANESREAQAS